MKLCKMLNIIYKTFDARIDHYDVFKENLAHAFNVFRKMVENVKPKMST